MVFAAACVWLIGRAWTQQPTVNTAAAGICLLTAPGGLPLIALDLGRFDVIGVLLLVVTLAMVTRWKPAASLVLVAVLGGVGVAVHEAALFAQVPLMLAAWWVVARPCAQRRGQADCRGLGVAAAVMMWIAAAGTLSPTEVEPALGRVSGYIAGDFRARTAVDGDPGAAHG